MSASASSGCAAAQALPQPRGAAAPPPPPPQAAALPSPPPREGDAGSPAPQSYAAALRHSFTSVEGLQEAGLISAAEAPALRPLAARYRLRVPRYYAALIDRDNLADCPIRLQALPQLGEQDPPLPPWAQRLSQRAFGRPVPWHGDPIGDLRHLAAPRLTHRYARRAIVHLSSICAMYCRFCFRKTHLNDAERPLYRGTFEPAIAYLRAQPQVREVILTGGDPLSLPTARLAALLSQLADLPQLRVVRLHSRMAATLPARLDAALVSLLAAQPFSCVLVSHFNHPRELTATARAALGALRRAGVVLYNQSVLLHRVNDDARLLRRLFTGLYEAGVTPYYLHHPDWTDGTFHFRVPIGRGRALMRWLRGRLSGPACPRYMLDVPGGLGKVDLLDPGLRRLEAHHDAALGGALYRVALPHTRAAQGPRQALYADLWRR